MKRRLLQLLAKAHADDRGTVAITFLLAFPLFLWIVCIFAQYALLVNARMAVNRAAMAAGRSAVTCMPTHPEVDHFQGDDLVLRAACMALVPVSPRAQGATTSEADEIVAAMQNLGLDVPGTFAERFSFAADATTIDWVRIDDNDEPLIEDRWEPLDFAQHVGQRIKLTVNYKFYINVPGVRILPSFGLYDTVGGIDGKFLTISATHIVQLTHGREAGANGLP